MKSVNSRYIPADVETRTFGNTTMFAVQSSDIINVVRGLRHENKLTLKLITATDESSVKPRQKAFRIWYVFGVPGENSYIIPYIELHNTEEFPSLTPIMHEAGNYERKIQSFFGLKPLGHPDQRPLILHENWPTDSFPLRKNFDWNMRPAVAQGSYAFQEVRGEGIYEIPVGPIHAGIIEPGHFRFSVAGEEIMLLEPRLGYVHKGSEKLFEILSLDLTIKLAEKISGDSSFSHSLAYCQAIEQLASIIVPSRARHLRVIYAELERLANHLGDIGAIMMDTGFNFGGSHGARLREAVMQINERLTGSRFLRGVNFFGGVTKDIDSQTAEWLNNDLLDLTKDFSEVIKVAENSSSLINRLKGTGTISASLVQEYGLVGLAAKAVGLPRDARFESPYAAYGDLTLGAVETETDGDVSARFQVRVKEVLGSIKIIQQALADLPKGAILTAGDIKLDKDSIAISCVEGWRGEIVYFVTTDSQGNLNRVFPRDPSFINWTGVGSAGLGNVVPDFPLINKSFNMSYSGNDL